MKIFAAATRSVLRQHGFNDAIPIIARMHNCDFTTAKEIARSVKGRQNDTISPLSDALEDA